MEQGLIILIIAVAISIVVAATRKKAAVNNEPLPKIEKRQENTQSEIRKEFNVIIKQDGKEMKGTAKMTQQGLQVFDENGNCVLDVTDRVTKILGELEIPKTDGFIKNKALLDGDFWFFFSEIKNVDKLIGVKPEDGIVNSLEYYMPSFRVEGDILHWNYNSAYSEKYRPDIKIVYGIY
ncbi:hypothetical protein [Dialister micraerophilus]|uniref:hypothetical protein n=1 Tax=Dialister micraerophilus TaxID=309120 RepID=UPI0005864A2C|nr:hypothetical protein [Dialister micraerophilus]